MPPKARGKAKARAKAAPFHRPAARLRRPCRRPAAAEEGTLWDQGLEVRLSELPPMSLGPGCSLAVTEASYFGEMTKVAGEVVKLEVEQGEVTLVLRVKGTTSEGLLRASTARPHENFRAHVCPQGCGKETVGDYVFHAVKGRKMLSQGDEGWTSNLEAGVRGDGELDENAQLRERARQLAEKRQQEGDQPPGGGLPRAGPPREENEQKDADQTQKKKKKKEKKKAKDVVNGRHAAVAVQKELKEIYSGTGLDPREKVRRRVLARAQKFVSRKKTKSSSSGSSSSSSSSSSPIYEDFKGSESIFSEETKVRGVAERCPGALTVEAVTAMRRALLTTSGEEGEETSLRPVALLYYRSVLAKKTSGAQSRELLNLAASLDLLLRGRIAAAADVIAQRLKAQEAVAQGTAWSVAVRMEVPPSEVGGLAGRSELQHAKREDYQESLARWRAQSLNQGKGDGKNKTKGQKGDRDAWRKDESKDQKGKGKEKK